MCWVVLGTSRRATSSRRSCGKHRYALERSDNHRYLSCTDSSWRQFRFSVGAPDAEAKYKTALQEVQKVNANALKYPSLYVRLHPMIVVFYTDIVMLQAFHGSPMKNWHSVSLCDAYIRAGTKSAQDHPTRPVVQDDRARKGIWTRLGT